MYANFSLHILSSRNIGRNSGPIINAFPESVKKIDIPEAQLANCAFLGLDIKRVIPLAKAWAPPETSSKRMNPPIAIIVKII